jgi:hypothetical protein
MSAACECHHLEEAHDPIAGCGYCHCERFRDATTEFTRDLRDLGDLALDTAKRMQERSGTVAPFFVLRGPDGSLKEINLPPGYVQPYNDRSWRHHIFWTIRTMVELAGCTGVITIGDAWFGRSTEKGRKLSAAEFHRFAAEQSGFQKSIDLGLVERTEAIVVTVQTPRRMMSMMQTYSRRGRTIVFQELLVSEQGLDKFTGAMKMFGNQEEEEEDVTSDDTADVAASDPGGRS